MQNVKKGHFYLVQKGLILLTSRSYHFDCAAKKNKKQETSNETRAFILISKNFCYFSSRFLWSNMKLTGYKRA